LNPKTKRHISRIIPFGVIFLVLGWAFLWTEFAVISPLEDYGVDIAIKITPKIFVFASISVFLVGCFIGFLEVVFINKLFISKTFKQKIFFKSLLYLVLTFVVSFVFYNLAAAIEMQKSIFSEAVFDRYIMFFYSLTHLSTLVQLSFSIVISLFFFEIRDNLGQNVLYNFFTGKYHTPILEQRIFMFIDMKNSTQIAEELGHQMYFELLRSYYNELSESIINNEGEVYQYIGDEVVISWRYHQDESVFKSVKCFFDMKSDLEQRKMWYLANYGVHPKFKGAIHFGEVTIGEIGALKKDIFFTGDVLNTTARIQSMCNTYQSELLISEAIYNQLIEEKDFKYKYEDEVVLKGKTKPIKLFSVNR
jgi:adenylate cyclase